MPKYSRRSNRKRTTTRKRKSYTRSKRRSSFKKSVQRISRSTQLKNCETKRLTVLNLLFSPVPLNNNRYQYYYKNLFWDVANGTTASTMNGNEIVDPYFTIKYSCSFNAGDLNYVNNATNGGVQSLRWFFAVVCCNDVLAQPTSQPQNYNPGATGDPGWWLNPDFDRMMFNGNNVKVIKKRTGQWHLPSLTQVAYNTFVNVGTEIFCGKMKVRLRRGKYTFEDQPGLLGRNYSLRGMNYYLVGGWALVNNITGSSIFAPLRLIADTYMYFKDP